MSPDIDIHTKNKYVPTELTQNGSDDEGEDRENIEILDYGSLNTASINTFMNTFTQMLNISLLDIILTDESDTTLVHHALSNNHRSRCYSLYTKNIPMILYCKIIKLVDNIIWMEYKLGVADCGRLYSV